MNKTKQMTSKERYEYLIATSDSKGELSARTVSSRNPKEFEHLSAAVDLVVFELAEFLADYDECSWPSLLAELRAPSELTDPRVSAFSKRHVERAHVATFKPWVPRIVTVAKGAAQALVYWREHSTA